MGHLEAHCSHVCLSHITERREGRYDSEPMGPDSPPEDNAGTARGIWPMAVSTSNVKRRKTTGEGVT